MSLAPALHHYLEGKSQLRSTGGMSHSSKKPDGSWKTTRTWKHHHEGKTVLQYNTCMPHRPQHTHTSPVLLQNRLVGGAKEEPRRMLRRQRLPGRVQFPSLSVAVQGSRGCWWRCRCARVGDRNEGFWWDGKKTWLSKKLTCACLKSGTTYSVIAGKQRWQVWLKGICLVGGRCHSALGGRCGRQGAKWTTKQLTRN